jgi:hypothetical protein
MLNREQPAQRYGSAAEQSVPLGDAVGAAFQSSQEYLPMFQGGYALFTRPLDFLVQDFTDKKYGIAGETIDIKEAKETYGLDVSFPISKGLARDLAERQRRTQEYQDVIARGPKGLVAGAATIGAEFIAQALGVWLALGSLAQWR